MSKHIQVEHPNGYYGELYGKSSLSIFKGTKEVFHTGFRSIETAEELYQVLEEYPKFEEMLIRAYEKMEAENGRKKNDSEDDNTL